MALQLAHGATAAAAGVAAHVGYFGRGEHHGSGARWLATGVVGVGGAAVLRGYGAKEEWRLSPCLCWALAMWASFLAGLYASVLTYRVFLHPLNRFPGPFAARISDLWLSLQLGGHDMHRFSAHLSATYGDCVRVGSSTLMLTHPQAVAALHAPGSRCRKAAMYDLEQPNRGIATRDRGLHAARRRLWSRGFGDKALRAYETRVAVYVDQLLARLARAHGEPVDAARLAEAFAFDVMGDVGLGSDFGMLQSATMHAAVEQLVQGLSIMGRRLPVWLMRLLVDVGQSLVPTEATTGFLAFCYHHLDRLMLMADVERAKRPSLIAPLIAHYEQQPPLHRDLSALRNDCRFIIVAGSDTVAATLAFALFYLAKHPQHVLHVRKELQPLRRANAAYADHQLRDAAPYLNAVISETLRLHPPASTILRITPPEGITVAGNFIPGDMTVFSSQYAIGRSETLYVDAASFRPERWHSDPSLVKDASGYAPFSMGPHSCIGRPLALLEMRLVLGETLSRYIESFAPEFDHGSFPDRVHDCMSWHIGNLDLCFTPLVDGS